MDLTQLNNCHIYTRVHIRTWRNREKMSPDDFDLFRIRLPNAITEHDKVAVGFTGASIKLYATYPFRRITGGHTLAALKYAGKPFFLDEDYSSRILDKLCMGLYLADPSTDIDPSAAPKGARGAEPDAPVWVIRQDTRALRAKFTRWRRMMMAEPQYSEAVEGLREPLPVFARKSRTVSGVAPLAAERSSFRRSVETVRQIIRRSRSSTGSGRESFVVERAECGWNDMPNLERYFPVAVDLLRACAQMGDVLFFLHAYLLRLPRSRRHKKPFTERAYSSISYRVLDSAACLRSMFGEDLTKVFPMLNDPLNGQFVDEADLILLALFSPTAKFNLSTVRTYSGSRSRRAMSAHRTQHSGSSDDASSSMYATYGGDVGMEALAYQVNNVFDTFNLARKDLLHHVNNRRQPFYAVYASTQVRSYVHARTHLFLVGTSISDVNVPLAKPPRSDSKTPLPRIFECAEEGELTDEEFYERVGKESVTVVESMPV